MVRYASAIFFSAIFAIVVGSFDGCQGPASTEINRPSEDVNGTRKLVLQTSEDESSIHASASYSDSSFKGFGPGIFITCNGSPVIDTRQTSFQSNTTIPIGFSDTSFDWVYEGPDTTFAFSEPSLSALEIIEPNADSLVEISNSFDSLRVEYEPETSAAGIAVTFLYAPFDSAERVDTLIPTITYDTATGTIAPIPYWELANLEDIEDNECEMFIMLVRQMHLSNPYTRTIIVGDSTTSAPTEFRVE